MTCNDDDAFGVLQFTFGIINCNVRKSAELSLLLSFFYYNLRIINNFISLRAIVDNMPVDFGFFQSQLL